MLHTNLGLRVFSVIASMLVVLATATPARAGTFIETGSEAFGTFGGIEYVRYTGRFEGLTNLGIYRMPFEIVAPADPGLGNGSVLIEPPHFFFGPAGRDSILGRAFLFPRGFGYAAVGYGNNGLNILDPTATDLFLAGVPLAELEGQLTEFEILVQFVQALETEPFAMDALGTIERKYGYGVSQTATAWLVVLHRPDGQGLLDFTLLDRDLWRWDVIPPEVLALLPEEFAPLSGIGKVIFIESEGDLLISDARQFRRAIVGPDADLEHYRVYEVAGAPHLPLAPPFNPLNLAGVVRAMLLAGDAWVRDGTPPPPSVLLQAAPEGAIDPVYGFETGIARDADGNALGGVRFPDVAVGRAFFLASLLDFEILPGLPGLVGAWFDLQCAPLADGLVRFPTHGDYVNRVVQQANSLRNGGYLLEADAEALKDQAAESEVGKPGACARVLPRTRAPNAIKLLPVDSMGWHGDAVRPLRGRLEGTAWFLPGHEDCGELELFEQNHLSGALTVFGQATWETSHCNASTFGGFVFNDGAGTLTAADGDALYVTFAGGGAVVDFDFESGLVTARGGGEVMVTGGTGRFTNAQSEMPLSFSSGATFPFDAPAGGGTASVFIELEGEISFDAADRRRH